MCIFRILDIFHLIYQVKHFHNTKVYNIKENLLFRILNHIVYIFFSYIIEFLSFIYYIEFLPKNFVIKKNSKISGIIHKSICVLNFIFIIVYNINTIIPEIISNGFIQRKNWPREDNPKIMSFFSHVINDNI